MICFNSGQILNFGVSIFVSNLSSSDQLDERFPGVKQKYVRQFGGRYECNSPQWRKLDEVFQKLVYKYQIATQMPIFTPEKVAKQRQGKQMKLF